MKRHLTCCILAASLHAAVAHAQSSTEPDRQTRVTLIQAATTARGEGRLQAALDLALRAEAISATAGTRLLVAQLRQQLGDHAGAMFSAEQCVREADSDTQTSATNRRVIRERCAAIANDARARTGTLRVDVPDGAPPTLEVRVNGELLRPALYGVARPITAGSVIVVASVPGSSPWQGQRLVTPGTTDSVRVELPTVAPTREPPPRASAPAMLATAPAAAPATTAAVPRATPPSPDGSTRRTLGLITAGVGVALAGVGVASGVMFQSAASDYEARRCAYVTPTAECISLHDSFGTFNTLQWVGYLGGGALVATGILLFFTAPSAAPRAAFACAPTPTGPGLSCVTTF